MSRTMKIAPNTMIGIRTRSLTTGLPFLNAPVRRQTNSNSSQNARTYPKHPTTVRPTIQPGLISQGPEGFCLRQALHDALVDLEAGVDRRLLQLAGARQRGVLQAGERRVDALLQRQALRLLFFVGKDRLAELVDVGNQRGRFADEIAGFHVTSLFSSQRMRSGMRLTSV